MVRGILAPSVLDRPVCGRRERRTVAGELLPHHVYNVYKRVPSVSSLPYLDLSSPSSSRDEKKTLKPRSRSNEGASKSGLSRRGLDGEFDEYLIYI